MATARMAITAVSEPRPKANGLSLLAEFCRSAIARMTDTYRPEKHYMRGPGPKCRAKAASAKRKS